MPYVRRNWQNAPSSATPLNAAALNNIEDGVEEAVEAVTGRLSEATLETTIGAVVAEPSLRGFGYPDDYYEVADGDDWLPAMLRAQTACRQIRLKADTNYEISRAIRNVSNRQWVFEPGSKITVDRAGSNAAARCAFMLGNIHPAMFHYASQGTGTYLPAHNISAVTAGAPSVTLSIAGNASAYSVGQFVVVRTTAEFTASGVQYPMWAQFTKVRAISGSTIELADPIMESIASACISPIGATTDSFMGYPWEFVENVEIIGPGKVDAISVVSTRTGAYNCRIENIEIIDGLRALAINAFVKCKVKNVRGDVFTDRLLEVKCYSSDSDFESVTGQLINSGSSSAVPFDIAEQANRCRFKGIRLTIPAGNSSAIDAWSVSGQLNSFDDCEVIHLGSNSGATALSMYSSAFTGYAPRGNKIRGGRVVVASGRSHHAIIGATGGEQPVDYLIAGVEFVGTSSTGNSIKVAAAGTRGVLRDSSLPGLLEISSGATAPVESGNSFSGVSGGSFAGGSAAPNAQTAESGTIYSRRGVADRMPLYMRLGSNGYQNWARVQVLGGYTARGDNDFTLNSGSAEVQDFTATLNSTRFVRLPGISNADPGWRFCIIKRSTAGAGALNIQDSSGSVIHTIAAGSKHRVDAVWTGSSWALDVIALV